MMGILKKQLELFVIFAFVYFGWCFCSFVDVVIVEIVLWVVVPFYENKELMQPIIFIIHFIYWETETDNPQDIMATIGFFGSLVVLWDAKENMRLPRVIWNAWYLCMRSLGPRRRGLKLHKCSIWAWQGPVGLSVAATWMIGLPVGTKLYVTQKP